MCGKAVKISCWSIAPLKHTSNTQAPPFWEGRYPPALTGQEKLDVSEVGFEPTPPCGDQKPQEREAELESGALDHSAILTLRYCATKVSYCRLTLME